MCSGMAELSRKQCLLDIQDLSSALTALYARSFLFFIFLNNFNGTETLRLFFPPDFDVSLPKSDIICIEEQCF